MQKSWTRILMFSLHLIKGHIYLGYTNSCCDDTTYFGCHEFIETTKLSLLLLLLSSFELCQRMALKFQIRLPRYE